MQRSLVNFQPLGPLSWAKGASSRLFYGACSCLLTKPSASGLAWENLSGTRGSHGCDVCVCGTYMAAEAVLAHSQRRADLCGGGKKKI